MHDFETAFNLQPTSQATTFFKQNIFLRHSNSLATSKIIEIVTVCISLYVIYSLLNTCLFPLKYFSHHCLFSSCGPLT